MKVIILKDSEVNKEERKMVKKKSDYLGDWSRGCISTSPEGGLSSGSQKIVF